VSPDTEEAHLARRMPLVHDRRHQQIEEYLSR
jgi:hypothetical protein